MEDIIELNENNFYDTLDNKEKLVVVMFYTHTCPNCKAITPIYESLSKELNKEAVFTKLNTELNMTISVKYGVMGVPTFKFFCKAKPIGDIVGSINATLLRNTIKDKIRYGNECVIKSTPIRFEMDGYG